MLEDEAGKSKPWCFPRRSRSTAALIVADAMLLVRGKYERDEESAPHRRDRDAADRGAAGAATREVEIAWRCRRTARPTFEALAELLERHPGDRRVSLELEVNGARRARCASARDVAASASRPSARRLVGASVEAVVRRPAIGR